MKLLVIEDEVLLANSLKTLLEKENFDVECVYNDGDGLAYANTNIYDLIILDVMLPKLNGYEVAKQARQPDDASSDVKLPFFILQLSLDWKLISANGGYYDLSDENFLNNLIAKAKQGTQDTGIIKENNLRYCRMKMPMGTVLVFSDMSSENRTLSNLLHSLIVIGLIIFFIFLIISIFLARWAVKPVAQAWTRQKQFVADASHELKTPLTVILTNAELLQCEEYRKSEHDNFLQSITMMSQQMKLLVDKMLPYDI